MQEIDQNSSEDIQMPEQPVEETSPQLCFFTAAIRVMYARDKALKERTVNVFIELNEPKITRDVLAHAQQNAMTRIMNEQRIVQEDFRDICFLGVTFLGQMTREEFHGKPDNTHVVSTGPEPTPIKEHASRDNSEAPVKLNRRERRMQRAKQ